MAYSPDAFTRDELGKLSKIKTVKHMEVSICSLTHPCPHSHPNIWKNKLKSLKVAQVKDEMDDDEDDGCDVVW